MGRRVVIIGISGASCSGKTLLAKNLRAVLPAGAQIVHQDDFAPPIEDVPYSPEYPDIQDWDDPETCILWPKFRSSLQHFRKTGTLPPNHSSHDHLNVLDGPQLSEGILKTWRERFAVLTEEESKKGNELVWCIVDGFVLYWDEPVVEALDIRFFLRVPFKVLKKRRDARSVYIMQNPDADGEVWNDPPAYFEKIVYPAYVKAHKHMFQDGDVENGQELPEWKQGSKKVKILLPGEGEAEVTRIFEEGCAHLIEQIRAGAGVDLS